jgi:hypothetical protein
MGEGTARDGAFGFACVSCNDWNPGHVPATLMQ